MSVRQKWRPRLAVVVASLVGSVLCLPIASLVIFNFYGKQIVQQTEEALIGQAAVYAAVFAEEFRQAGGDPKIGRYLPADLRPDPNRRYHPFFPSLAVESDQINPPRSEPQPAIRPILPLYGGIGSAFSTIAVDARDTTLAGFRAVDPFGRVVGGSGEVGYSLMHVPEVRTALSGQRVTLIRQRISDNPDPPLWSISRRTDFRVFVALPVVVDNYVVGAVYLSRTPGNVVQYLYQERADLLRAVLLVLGAAIAIGFVFWRFITRPIYGLTEQAMRVSLGKSEALDPDMQFGTRELAGLGQNFIALADGLRDQANSVKTYTDHVTHELKSPISSIAGAIELLQDDADLSAASKEKLLGNIASDAGRMTTLLEKLAALASAKARRQPSVADLDTAIERISRNFNSLEMYAQPTGAELPLRQESLEMIVTHFAENSSQHGARSICFSGFDRAGKKVLRVSDDGCGISEKNTSRIFDPFFTTRRESGGTGMGLGIVEALVRASNGHIRLIPSECGATFEIEF